MANDSGVLLEGSPPGPADGTAGPALEAPTGRPWYVRTLVAAIVAAGVIVGVAGLLRLFVISSYVVDGNSMYPTLGTGQRILVNRLADPGVGDIVVADPDAGDRRAGVVKRIVAEGGDRVESVGCRLFRNGVPVDESYLFNDEVCGADVEPFVVPDGFVYLLGDNRAGSLDSRQFGPVPESMIVGVLLFSL